MDKRINKVLLVVPPCTLPVGRINVSTAPLGVMYLAAVLEKQGYRVKILDCLMEGYSNGARVNQRDVRYGLSYDLIKEEVAKFSPDLVGISCQSSIQFANTVGACKVIRKVGKDFAIVMGGPHSTVFPEKVMAQYPEIDFIIMGEGEYSFRDLIAELNRGGKTFTPLHPESPAFQSGDERNIELVATEKPRSLDRGVTGFTNIDGLVYRDNGKIIINPKKTLIQDLDELPFPARHLLPFEKYFKINFNQNLSFVPRSVSVMTSRGCSLKCIFCFNKNFWLNKYRVRSPENIVAEIDEIYNKYKIKELQFSDDNLTGDRDRAFRLFELMKKRKYPFKWSTPNGLFVHTLDEKLLKLMKEAGCYEIRIAIESGNEDVLHNIIKKAIKLSKVEEVLRTAQRLGLLTSAFMSIGYPGETREQILQTFAYARKVRPGCVFLSVASPLPNTELMDLSVKKGMDVNTDHFEDFEFSTVNADTDQLSRQELGSLYIKNMFLLNFRLLYTYPKAFYMRWGVLVWRHPIFSLKLVLNHFKRLLIK